MGGDATSVESMLPLLEKFKSSPARVGNSVGLDIGTSGIKAVKLKFVKEVIELEGFVLKPAQPGLKSFLESQEIKKANISLSGPSTIIRYVNFPKMSGSELKQAMKFEAQKSIPFSVDDVNLDSCILRPDLPDNKMLVMLAAAKKEFVKERLKLLENSGVKVHVIDLDSLALVNAFNFNYSTQDDFKNKAVALLNIGASFSNLNILEAGLPVLSRDMHIAGNTFTQKIKDMLAVDFKTAEELKITPDKERLTKIAAAVESALSGLANDLRTSFDYYESQSASSVVRIFLSGGGSLFTALKDTLANLLGIEVDYWDPFKKITLGKDIDAESLKAASSQLTVAAGLALRA